MFSSLSVVDRFEDQELAEGWGPNFNVVEVLEFSVSCQFAKITPVILLRH